MKSLNEIIAAALEKAPALELEQFHKAQRANDMSGSESLPHAIGCSTSGHEVRLPSKDELNLIAANAKHGRGYFAVFCTHNVPYWTKCTKCGRNAASAAKNVPIVIASLKRLA